MGLWVLVGLTFVPLQLVLRHGVCAAVKVFLKRVHLPAQDVSEGLHLCQLLSQSVTLLKKEKKSNKAIKLLFLFPKNSVQPFKYACVDKINSPCVCKHH